MAGTGQLARPARPSAAPGPRSLIGRLLDALAGTAAALVTVLLFSIAIEWIGLTWWWPGEGARHAKDLYRTERTYLQLAFPKRGNAILDAKWPHEFRQAASTLADLLSVRTPSRLLGLFETLSPYVEAAGWIMRVFGVRLALVILCLPICVLFAVIGLSEGLMRRDLRRWGGGRESSFIYHHVRPWIGAGWLGSVCIYLSLPVAVHPLVWLLPSASGLALALGITASRFKKYL